MAVSEKDAREAAKLVKRVVRAESIDEEALRALKQFARRSDPHVQAVFASVFQHVSTGRYTERGQFESWLFRIAMNRIRDQIRRNTRRLRTESTSVQTISVKDEPSQPIFRRQQHRERPLLNHSTRADGERLKPAQLDPPPQCCKPRRPRRETTWFFPD